MHQDHSVSPSVRTGIFSGALAVSLGGAMAFAAVLALRSGLGDAIAPIIFLYLLGIVPIWLSAWALSSFGVDGLRSALALMIALMAGTLLPVLGFVFPPAVLALAAIALLLGIWGGGRALLAACRDWRLVIAVLLTAALLILLTVPLRFYMQEALLVGAANSDNYLHAANMQMLAHYGRIALGADGLVYQSYHWLFHILVTGAARAADADVTLAYGYWTSLVLKLQLVWALFAAGQVLYPPQGERAAAWRLAYGWLAMAVAGGFEMESYMEGIALMMGWLPLLLALLRPPATAPVPRVAIAVLAVGAFICAGGKASVGYYCAIGLVLLAWHTRSRVGVVVFLLGSLAGLAVFANSLLIPKDVLIASAGFGILAVSYLNYLQRGILMHYLLAPLLALVFVWRPQGLLRAQPQSLALNLTAAPAAGDSAALPGWLACGGSGLRLLRWLALVDARAQFLLLALLGTLFVVFTMPIGDNLWDFSVILFMLALLLLPAALGETLHACLTDRAMKWALALGLAAETLLAAIQFSADPITSLPQAWVALYRQASGTTAGQSTGAAKDIVLSLKTRHRLLARLHNRIAVAPVTLLKQALEQQARAVDGRLAVQVSPTAGEVWQFFRNSDAGKWCLYPHLLVPAATGVVEIRSVATAELQQACMVPGMVWYGYGKYQDLHRTGDFTPTQLCAWGQPIGIRRIYRLESLSQRERNSVIDCSSH